MKDVSHTNSLTTSRAPNEQITLERLDCARIKLFDFIFGHPALVSVTEIFNRHSSVRSEIFFFRGVQSLRSVAVWQRLNQRQPSDSDDYKSGTRAAFPTQKGPESEPLNVIICYLQKSTY